MTLRRARPKPRRAAGARPESEPVTAALVPPYPPSWFDRFTAWVDRLSGPAWAFYLILAAAAVLIGTAIQWKEGAFPVGTFSLLQVWNLANFAYLLALMHYLDKTAASALVRFRPLLTTQTKGRQDPVEDETVFASLSYRLTTLPARPALVATFLGAVFPILGLASQVSSGDMPTPFLTTAPTALSRASVMLALMLANAFSFLLFYHSLHQLSLVSRIYTRLARINVYQLQPLYALSRPGALTALGLIAYVYTWSLAASASDRGISTLEAGLTLGAAGIAVAAFGLPLWGAHRRLVSEKEARLAEVSARFEAASAQLHQELDRRRLAHMDPLNKALASLETEQNALRRVPTWPWEPGALRGLIAALLLPIVIWLIQFFLGRWLGA